MSIPVTTTGRPCPGCVTVDVQQPHNCGLFTQTLAPGYCYRCNQPWSVQHVCITALQGLPGWLNDPIVPPVRFTPPAPTVSPLTLMKRAAEMVFAGRLTREAFRELFYDETTAEASASIRQIDAERLKSPEDD